MAETAKPPVDEIKPAEDITSTPAFEMALAAKTAEIHAQISAEMKAEFAKILGDAKAQPSSDAGDMTAMARSIALAIAEMTNQGSGKKTVAPAIMEARSRSHDKMVELLMAARELAQKDRPKYRLITSIWAKDRLVHPFHTIPGSKTQVPTDIYFVGVPSLGMRPINAVAKKIFAAFMGSIGNGESEVPFVVKPIWVTDSGVIIAGTAPQTMAAHGRVMEVDTTYDVDDAMGAPGAVGTGDAEDDDMSFVNQNDPRANEVYVLGTIAKPASRTQPTDKRV